MHIQSKISACSIEAPISFCGFALLPLGTTVSHAFLGVGRGAIEAIYNSRRLNTCGFLAEFEFCRFFLAPTDEIRPTACAADATQKLNPENHGQGVMRT